MTWQFWAFLSSILFALYMLYMKMLSNRPAFDSAMLPVTRNLLAACLLGPYVWLGGHYANNPLNFQIVLILVTGCILSALGNLFMMKSIVRTPASEMSLVSSIQPLLAMLFAALLLNEMLPPAAIAGVCLIVAGLMLVFWQRGRLNWHRGHLWMLATTLLFSLGTLVDGSMSRRWNLGLYLFFGSLGISLILLLIQPNSLQRLVAQLRQDTIRILGLVVLNLSAVIAILQAYRLGPIGMVIAVTYLATLWVVIFGALFLNERTNLPRKLAAALVMLGGIWLLRG